MQRGSLQMKKKTIRVFYSWQDDIDSKLNRSFIKDCLESALRKINKTAELEEAYRPDIRLDHDTKDIPGIPDIANTILQKISATDIFIADLSFVSDYINCKGASKKISNQNVIFELGFAFNVLGPHKIICIFNEAFGMPKDLLFDLQNRRWPITFKLLSAESSTKKAQKDILIQKLEQAILAITKTVPTTRRKSGLHNPFSSAQHNEFEYLYDKLNFKIDVFIEYEPRWSPQDYYGDAPPKKPLWPRHKNVTVRFIPVLLNFIAVGQSHFNRTAFHTYIQNIVESYISTPEGYDCEIQYGEKDVELSVRTLALISLHENKFLQKTYNFIHWLDFNGYKDTEIKIEEVK